MTHPAQTTAPPTADMARVNALRELAACVYKGMPEEQGWQVARHLAHPHATVATWSELCNRVGRRIAFVYGVVSPEDIVGPSFSTVAVDRQHDLAAEVLDGMVLFTLYRLLRGGPTPCVNCFHDRTLTIADWQPMRTCAVHGGL